MSTRQQQQQSQLIESSESQPLLQPLNEPHIEMEEGEVQNDDIVFSNSQQQENNLQQPQQQQSSSTGLNILSENRFEISRLPSSSNRLLHYMTPLSSAQELMFIGPLIKIFFTLIMEIVCSVLLSERDGPFTSFLVLLALTSLAIYSSLLLCLLVVLCWGWQVSRSYLSHGESTMLTFVMIVVYLAESAAQTGPSDSLATIITLYTFLCIVVFIGVRKNCNLADMRIRFLEDINFGGQGSAEIISFLRSQKRTIRELFAVIILYCLVDLVMGRFGLALIMESPVVAACLIWGTDFLAWILLMRILRPKPSTPESELASLLFFSITSSVQPSTILNLGGSNSNHQNHQLSSLVPVLKTNILKPIDIDDLSNHFFLHDETHHDHHQKVLPVIILVPNNSSNSNSRPIEETASLSYVAIPHNTNGRETLASDFRVGRSDGLLVGGPVGRPIGRPMVGPVAGSPNSFATSLARSQAALAIAGTNIVLQELPTDTEYPYFLAALSRASQRLRLFFSARPSGMPLAGSPVGSTEQVRLLEGENGFMETRESGTGQEIPIETI